jgi:hypothetical protein
VDLIGVKMLVVFGLLYGACLIVALWALYGMHKAHKDYIKAHKRLIEALKKSVE